MWLASILFINTLTLLTIADTDRGRPTLKVKDERFRNRLFRGLHYYRTLMCTRSNLCLHVSLNRSNCLNVLLNCTEICCSIAVNGRMKNIDEVINELNNEVNMNAEWKNVYTCTIKVTPLTVIFVINFIVCIVYCSVIQNKVDAIQHFLVSYIQSVQSHNISPNKSGNINMLPSDDPVSLDNNILPVNVTPKFSALSVQVVDVNKSEALHRTN